jgi:hypothetical protein
MPCTTGFRTDVSIQIKMGETMIKVKIDDQEHEVKPESLQLPEGYALIEPGKVPKGFFNQDALNEIVSERV